MLNHIVLGFDVGSHKIGTAIGQSLTQQAKPLARLRVVKNGLPAATEITQLIREWKPTCIAVGMPLKMDGTEQFTTQLAKNFIVFLKTLTSLPIHEVDERLTTKTARSELFEQGGYKQLKKADVDGYAAKLIVESWLKESS